MSSRAKIITTVALLVFLGGLGIADYQLSKAPALQDDTVAQTSSTTTTVTTSGSVAAVPTGGVKKQNGPAVADTIAAAGFSTTDSNDLSFLTQIAGSGTTINSLAILKNGDRAGSVTWIESPRVKNIFIALKEALLTAFSSKVQDLKDQTLTPNDGPVRNELTFFDPTLSTERLVFVRVRERLFEFHIVIGKEDTFNPLIEALTAK